MAICSDCGARYSDTEVGKACTECQSGMIVDEVKNETIKIRRKSSPPQESSGEIKTIVLIVAVVAIVAIACMVGAFVMVVAREGFFFR